MQLNPSDDLARSERGLQFVAGGKSEQGIADLKWYVARHPDDADGYYNLGVGEAGLDFGSRSQGPRQSSVAQAGFRRGPCRARQPVLPAGESEAALKDLEFAAATSPAPPASWTSSVKPIWP